MMSSSSTENTEEDPSDEYMCTPSTSGGRPRRRIVDAKLAASLDVAKLSHRGAALVLTPAIQSLGHSPAEY